MRGLWHEDGRVTLRDDLPRPTPAAGEALVLVRLAGICATDLEILRGYFDYTGVPGHEFVGVVVSAPGASALEGERVVGEINATCGACSACLAGRPNHCERRTVLGIDGRAGAFAEYLTLPAVNLHRVPTAVPDDAAVFCEPLAAAYQVIKQVPILPNDRVVVVGAGRLGQLVAQVLATRGCELEVVARHDNQRTLLGIRGITAIDEEELRGGAADVVIEASGAPLGFELARRAVRPGGTIVLKSTYAAPLTVNASLLVVDGITLVGSRCGPFAPALRLLAQPRQVDPRPLVEARYTLDEGVEALEHADRPGAMKVLLRP